MDRRYFLIILLIALLIPALAHGLPGDRVAQASPSTQAEVALAVEAGYNGYFRAGEWMPVHVTATNQTDRSIDGSVRVRTQGLGGLADIAYQTPVYLTPGSVTPLYLYVSLEAGTTRIQVEVVDEHGDIAGSQAASVDAARRDDVLFAVITDSGRGVVDVAVGAPGTGQAHQVSWRFEMMPPLVDALAGLDVILVYNTDTSTGTLQPERIAALTNWVLAGGHLIVAQSNARQLTSTGLQDLLPVTLTGEAQVRSLGALGSYLGVPPEPLEQPGALARSTPKPGARTLATVGTIPLIVRHSYGAGTVDFLAFDLDQEPVLSWGEIDRLWYALTASTGPQPSWASGFENWTAAGAATRTTSNNALPTFLQLCGFLALYIVLAGPLNYLLLKQIGRREWAWFTIPLLIVAFSALAYTVGFNLRGDTAIVNRLTVVRMWPGSEQAQVSSLIGVQSPRRATYDITVERGYTLRSLPEEGAGLSVPVSITEGTSYSAGAIPIDAGTVASFTANGYEPLGPLEASVTWYLDSSQTLRVMGWVRNTLDSPLQDAVLLLQGDSHTLGTLAPGETRPFDIPVGVPDPAPLTLGNPLNQYNLNTGPGSPSYNNQWRCFSYNGIALTIPQVMGDERFVCSPGNVSDRQQEIRRRYQLLGALVNDADISGGRGATLYLFGWNDDALVDVTLADKRQQQDDTTLYVVELPVDTTSEPRALTPHGLTPSALAESLLGLGGWQTLQPVEVPPGMTTWTVIETGDPATLTGEVPANIRLQAGDQAAFQFMPLPELRLAQVGELEIRYQGRGPIQVELWNWYRQEWQAVQLATASAATHIPVPDAHIGPENAVNVRVRALNESEVYREVDYIKIGYRGWLAG